ncbi:hypothetical protein GF407_02620 [candidate division KSB1 bacterium]|nr:hypothetical protein [candidate division KSB1 bacterium]
MINLIKRKPSFDFNPEIRMLLASAHSRLSDKQRQSISSLLNNRIDWQTLVQLAQHQGIFPLFYKNINSIDSSVWPQSGVRDLRLRFYTYVYTSTVLLKEHLELIQLLQKASLRAIPYKGPVFTRQFYGDPVYRQYCDLDILVCKDDFLEAHQVLLEYGFTLMKKPDEELAHSFKYDVHWSYYHGEKKYRVELHWDLVKQKRLKHAFHLEEHWDNLQQVEIDGIKFKNFDLSHLLLFSCMHSAKHSFASLKWICDISEMVKDIESQQWSHLIGLSKRYHIYRILQTGLALAFDLLQAEVPYPVMEKCRTRPVYILEKMAFSNIFTHSSQRLALSDNLLNYLFIIISRERFGDKLIAEFFLPNERDRKCIPLPAALHFLYFFVRIFRLSRVYLKYLFSLLYKRSTSGTTGSGR